jgi:hypothetical protein
MHVLSGKMARTIVGGDVLTSNTWISNCVQNRASVEFWERQTLMFLDGFPRACVFGVLSNAEREISSSFCASNADEDRELESPDAPVGAFFDPVNINLHRDFPFSADAGIGTVLGVWIEGASSSPACPRTAGDSRENGGGSDRKVGSG